MGEETPGSWLMASVQAALHCHAVCCLPFTLRTESLSLGVVGRNILGRVAPSNTCDGLEQTEQENLEK